MTWLETDSRMRMPKSAVSAAYCSGFSSRACTTWYPYARTFATVVATRRKSAPECARARDSIRRTLHTRQPMSGLERYDSFRLVSREERLVCVLILQRHEIPHPVEIGFVVEHKLLLALAAIHQHFGYRLLRWMLEPIAIRGEEVARARHSAQK